MAKYMTADQVAEILQVHRETVLRALRSGRLHGVQPFGDWRVSQEALDRFLVNPPPTGRAAKKAEALPAAPPPPPAAPSPPPPVHGSKRQRGQPRRR